MQGQGPGSVLRADSPQTQEAGHYCPRSVGAQGAKGGSDMPKAPGLSAMEHRWI